MLIGIDYDETYTRDPKMWDAFRVLAKAYGHECMIVTGRRASHAVECKWPVCYSEGDLKQDAAVKQGFKVDIWIDDMPGTIQRCTILEW